MERDERAMEKIASAFEVIADTLTAWYKLDVQRYELEHPIRPAPRDAVVTAVKSDKDLLEESQGKSSEPLSEWIGLREQQVIAGEASRTDRSEETRSPQKAGGKPGKTGGRS